MNINKMDKKRLKDYSKYFLPNLSQARKRLKDLTAQRHNFDLTKNYLNLGKNKKFYVRTYGCQSNVRDSEDISGLLRAMNFKSVDDIEKADLVILNTCAVRENAEKKVFGEIGFLKHLKNKNPNFLFGVCGCMPQEEAVAKKIIDDIEHVDFVFGTHNIHMLPEILDQVINHHQKVVQVYSKEGDVIEGLPSARSSKIKAFVNIMYGCDNFCTYCIVPYTRGKVRSRSKEDILKEIHNLIKDGYQEITLLGQNVNSYGNDFKTDYHFWNLLEDVALTKIPRIRFATSNPWNFDLRIIEIMKLYKNIMPYVHIPVQSGDETILKAMNRAMKMSDYIDLIDKIRAAIPNCSISTDLIVGFPNETDEQFANTLKLFHRIKFDNAYTFIYSPRKGTSAALMDDHTSLATKKVRLAKLNELVRQYAKSNNEKWINQNVEVLVEGKSKTNDKVWTGYTPEWKVVNFTGTTKPGKTVTVLVNSISRFSLNGEIVKR